MRGSVSRGVYRFVQDEGRTVTGWKDRVDLARTSTNGVVQLRVSLAQLEQAQVPTTFKHYGGKRVNVYHIIHVDRLRALAALGGQPFLAYAQRWSDYQCRWASHPTYALIPASDLTC